MDQYTRRIIGFAIQREVVDGMMLCRMFKQAIRSAAAKVPKLRRAVDRDHPPGLLGPDVLLDDHGLGDEPDRLQVVISPIHVETIPMTSGTLCVSN